MIRIFWFIGIWIVALAQGTLVTRISLGAASPDFTMVLVALLALRLTPAETVIWGAFAGFLLDLFDPIHMGARILAFAIAAFILGNGQEHFNMNRPLMHISIFALTVALAHGLIYIFCLPSFGGVWEAIQYIVLSPILSALLLVIVDISVRLLGFRSAPRGE